MRVWFAGGGTGGHLYPGLAIARALVRQAPGVEPFFVGARRGIERDVLPTTEFPHVLLDLHPLYRARPWENWKTVRGAAAAWGELGALAATGRPAGVVGTGGYASGLALGYGAAKGVPLFLQEQNSFAGMTTRFFSRRARTVFLGFPEAEGGLPHRGAEFVDSGNPIEPPPVPRPGRDAARRVWSLPADGDVLLVYGGSQGARAVNDAVAGMLDAGRLPAGLSLIWATGKGSFDHYARFDGDRVRVRPYLSPIRDAYAAADLAVARAGAISTAELCAWGIPSVLVPLPTAAADHQTANARALEHAGASVLLRQSELTPDRLADVLAGLRTDPSRLAALRAGAVARARPRAADEIASRIAATLGAR